MTHENLAQTILANTVDQLHALSKMLIVAEDANDVDAAIKLAKTIANIKRDAYAVQASAEASARMAMAAMVGGQGGGDGLAKVQALAARLTGRGLGKVEHHDEGQAKIVQGDEAQGPGKE